LLAILSSLQTHSTVSLSERRVSVVQVACPSFQHTSIVSSTAYRVLTLYDLVSANRPYSLHLFVFLQTQEQIQFEKLKLALYNWWFATPKVEEDGQSKPEFTPETPMYNCRTGKIPFTYFQQLIRLRTGTHHLVIETVIIHR
jgi:hypothetical protein